MCTHYIFWSLNISGSRTLQTHSVHILLAIPYIVRGKKLYRFLRSIEQRARIIISYYAVYYSVLTMPQHSRLKLKIAQRNRNEYSEQKQN